MGCVTIIYGYFSTAGVGTRVRTYNDLLRMCRVACGILWCGVWTV